ncbi:MAG: histidine kinase [Pseudomonadales bacterium]|jgi:two-component system sensor histidine kinase AlgZ|tara:strand:- start:7201 stop:8259 length:1059 start_codon:yes stop_codon:yes gene_type:complete
MNKNIDIAASDLQQDFFLPDLCQAQSILFLVLVAELLVFVQILFSSSFFDFDWLALGLASLFIQWVVLASAALLCNIRPWLMGMSVPKATGVAYGLILLLVLVFSLGAEMILEGMVTVTESGWGRIVRNLLIAMIMTGIAFRYFFLSHQLRSREQAELTSRIQSLQSRIRPHFLFNSMNIIASLISIDPALAEEVVEDLSSLFRASLNDSTSGPVTLAQELDLCEKYVHIESLRLDDRLTVQWDVNVDTDAVMIPLLTLQPLLENSIYHGIQPLLKGGTVTVSVEVAGPQVQIEITNPMPETPYDHERGNRMAIDNIRNRMTALFGQEALLTTGISKGLFTARLVYPVKSAK